MDIREKEMITTYEGKEIDLNALSKNLELEDNGVIVLDALEEKNIVSNVEIANRDISFIYNYNGTNINYSSEVNVVSLASNEAKFDYLCVPGYVSIGETLDLDAYVNYISGGLKYEDGTRIELANIEMNSDPKLYCSLGEDRVFDITSATEPFTLTLVLDTVYWGELRYEFAVEIFPNQMMGVEFEFVNLKATFHENEVMGFGCDALLNIYIENDLIRQVPSQEFGRFLNEMPTYVGYRAKDNDYGTETLAIADYEQEVSINIDALDSVTFNDSSLYETQYVTSPEYFSPQFSNNAKFSFTRVLHYANGSSEETTTRDLNVTDFSSRFSFSYPSFSLTNSANVPVTITYRDNYGAKERYKYTAKVVLLRETSLKVEVSGDYYFDSGVDTFHLPQNATYKLKMSDNSERVINASRIKFYRDKSLIEELVVGESIINSDIDRIYVKDTVTYASGYYFIDFEHEQVLSISAEVVENATFVLGNTLESYKSNFIVTATLGNSSRTRTAVITDYEIRGRISATDDSGKYLLQASDLYMFYGSNGETLVNSSSLTFVEPSVSKATLNSDKLQKCYANKLDGIDCTDLEIEVEYENATYVQKIVYGNTTFSSKVFNVSCEDLPNYIFDGSEKIDIGTIPSTTNDGVYKEIVLEFKFAYFTSQTSATIEEKVNVFDSLKISAVNILRGKDPYQYKVGDKFLNENDNTIIRAYFISDQTSNLEVVEGYLRDYATIVNIYPQKDYVFKTTGVKDIQISSIFNNNVSVSYSINVEAPLSENNIETLTLVAVKYDGYNSDEESTYVLVEEKYTWFVDGQRVLKSDAPTIWSIAKGYLQDLNNKNANAKVVLFNDYIPEIDGQNNIEVTFPCYVEGNADKINKCTFGILFGNNNAKNRLFLSGNPDTPNCDWHSGDVISLEMQDDSAINGNFGYFEDTSYCFYGETDNKVIGYDIVSNDKLLVLKDYSDKETTVYFRTPTLVTAIDGAGTQVTGINGETLYQEEFSLTKGNNSVAGVSPFSIVNFNGDSVFMSHDKNIVGLDLVGIVGDNQRYANTRSLHIDRQLEQNKNIDKVWLFTDNKYLFVCEENRTFIAHYEAKTESQYEWWVINVGDIQSMLNVDNTRYFANSDGSFYKFSDIYSDVDKVFIQEGGAVLFSENENDDKVIINNEIINLLDKDETYTFYIKSDENDFTKYMYYAIAKVNNSSNSNTDLLVDSAKNALKLVCYENGSINKNKATRLKNVLKDGYEIFLNHYEDESEITAHDLTLKEFFRRYYLKEITYDDDPYFIYYKLYDYDTNIEQNVNELRCIICERLKSEYVITEINKSESSFKLLHEGEVINLVRYGNEPSDKVFAGEIKHYKNVEAYYISNPYTLGSLNYFKTIWQWTVTNDTNIPSELEVTWASNKVPNKEAKTLNKISVDNLSTNFDNLSFEKVDFDKQIVPRTYTNHRILSRQKFVCFGFKNYNNTNSVLSSMSITYSIPMPSYSGE